MKIKILLIISALLFINGFSIAQEDSAVLAQIGNKKLTLGEFNKRYQEVKIQTLNPPTKQQLLEDLVRYFVGLQEAEKAKIKDDPIVQERIQQEIYKGLLEKVIGPEVNKIQVTDEEMKNWYKNNPEIRTSHILIEFKQNAKPEEKAAAKKRAQEILDKEVKNSKRPFEELVRLFTDDPLSKQTGGDVGWQTRLTLVPSYYDAAYNMKVGEIKGLIETPYGYHIIKVTGRHTFENANKRQIRTAVFDEKRKAIFNKYFEKVKKDYSIKVNDSLIK